jgi:hypothetical protein
MTPKRESTGDLPDPLRKREILYSSDTPAEELTALGRAFLDKGLPMDALDCFAEARSRPDLEDLLERAIQDGDYFVLRRCALALGRKPSGEERKRLAVRARELGKEAFATAAEKADGPSGEGQDD